MAYNIEDRIEKSLTVRFLGQSKGYIGNKEGKNTLSRIPFTVVALISSKWMGGYTRPQNVFVKTCIFKDRSRKIGVTDLDFALGHRK